MDMKIRLLNAASRRGLRVFSVAQDRKLWKLTLEDKNEKQHKISGDVYTELVQDMDTIVETAKEAAAEGKAGRK